jgi:hypothetical protein
MYEKKGTPEDVYMLPLSMNVAYHALCVLVDSPGGSIYYAHFGNDTME